MSSALALPSSNMSSPSSSLAAASLELVRETVLNNPYIPQVPTIKQAIFLGLPVKEALYGGAAGGGKSSALLMAALQFVHVPGYAALLLRRTYQDLALPGALMQRAKEWLSGTDAVWRASEHTWYFPSGATLTFGYLDHDDDIYRYQSSEFQFIGFDELTQFTREQYLFLFSRLRRLLDFPVPIRMRAASNPNGIGREWVRERFPVSRDPKLAEPARRAGRVFVPARIEDNPYLDQEQYRAMLAELPAVERAQLELGDWDIQPKGPVFQRHWFAIIAEPRHDLRLVRAWDLASTPKRPKNDPDWTVGALVGERDGIYDVVDVVRLRGTPHEVQQAIMRTAHLDGRGVPVIIEQEPGASGLLAIDQIARALPGFRVYARRPEGSKLVRAEVVAAAAERGAVRLVRGAWNAPLLDTFQSFPYGPHDDDVDAVSLAFAELANRPRVLAW